MAAELAVFEVEAPGVRTELFTSVEDATGRLKWLLMLRGEVVVRRRECSLEEWLAVLAGAEVVSGFR